MRGATDCAKRLKLLFSSLRSKLGKVGHPPVTDPVTQMLLGILSRDTPEAKASEGLDRLRSVVVDYNELRVIPPIELAETLGDFPDARLKCEDVSRSLNSIFAMEHAVSLDRLQEMSRRDVQAYLARIEGLEPYTMARVRLLGLQHHAVPLDEAMWAWARHEQVVAPRCTLQDAEQFLERHVAEGEALEFVTLVKKQAWSEFGSAVKKGEVERITSTPPDRSSRNMLQMVSMAGAADEIDVEVPEPEMGELGEGLLGEELGLGSGHRGGDGDEEAVLAEPAAGAKPGRAARPRSAPAGKGKPPRPPATTPQRGTKSKAITKPAASKAAPRVKRKPESKSRARKPSAKAKSA